MKKNGLSDVESSGFCTKTAVQGQLIKKHSAFMFHVRFKSWYTVTPGCDERTNAWLGLLPLSTPAGITKMFRQTGKPHVPDFMGRFDLLIVATSSVLFFCANAWCQFSVNKQAVTQIVDDNRWMDEWMEETTPKYSTKQEVAASEHTLQVTYCIHTHPVSNRKLHITSWNLERESS